MVKIIDTNEYIAFLKKSVGVKIWKLIHPADQIIHFYMGKKVSDRTREYPESGQYMLYVDGQWTYQKDGRTIETSAVLEGEDRQAYMRRTESFVENLKPNHIKDFVLGKDGNSVEIVFDDGSTLTVAKTKYGLLSLSVYRASPKGAVVGAEHVSANENGEYELVKSS